ncbi:MAG: fatty acid desaturase [Hyphococcus sp.]
MSTRGQGASDLETLKILAYREANGFAWPTFWLGVGTIVAIAGGSALALAGVIPLWLAGVVNFCGFCSGYTVGHEIIHNNLTGKRRDLAWLDMVFATLFFSVPFHSYTMHKFLHLQHHAYTNHPQKDPDAWISGRNIIELLFKLATHYPHYQYHAIVATRGAKNRWRFLTKSMIEQIVPMIIAGYLIVAGYGLETLMLWIAPAVLIYPALAFILDWIPHHDLKEGSPIESTRLLGAPRGVAGAVLNWLYLFQNYHLIHHLYPRLPFYRYAHVYFRGEKPLRENGAMVWSGFDS